jgi:addiction module HigA family antidote
MAPKTDRLEPIPPGEILLEDFMKPYGISQNKLARDIDVTPARIGEIVRGKRAITADTALRLAKYFRTSPDVWLGLQMEYDLRRARRETWPAIEPRIRAMDAA